MKKDLVVFEKVCFGYDQNNLFLDNISFTLQKGDFALLLGENGSGKSTLVKLLLHKLKPLKGSIFLQGEDVSLKKNWRTIGYVPQKVMITANHPVKVSELISDPHICKHLSIDSLQEKQFHNQKHHHWLK